MLQSKKFSTVLSLHPFRIDNLDEPSLEHFSSSNTNEPTKMPRISVASTNQNNVSSSFEKVRTQKPVNQIKDHII